MSRLRLTDFFDALHFYDKPKKLHLRPKKCLLKDHNKFIFSPQNFTLSKYTILSVSIFSFTFPMNKMGKNHSQPNNAQKHKHVAIMEACWKHVCLSVYWEGISAPKINQVVCSHNLLSTGSRESRKCSGDKWLPPGEIWGVRPLCLLSVRGNPHRTRDLR